MIVNVQVCLQFRSGTELRDKIRQERRIELAFEGQRYYDLRRWKTLQQGMGDAIGMKIVKNADGTKTYTKKTVQARIFTEKVYWQPIPMTEIQKNDSDSEYRLLILQNGLINDFNPIKLNRPMKRVIFCTLHF
jgi:hypothetical protein